MMTNAIRFDHFEKKILISKSFAKAAMNPNSKEYRDLKRVMAAHQDYQIDERVIKRNSSKETYEGLNYDYMRNYIRHKSLTMGEENKELAEFDEMILISKCHAKALRYPTIKKWFLEKYPEVAKFGVKAAYEALTNIQKREQSGMLLATAG